MPLSDVISGAGSTATRSVGSGVNQAANGVVNRGVNTVIGGFNQAVQTNLSSFVMKGSSQLLKAVGISPTAIPELRTISSSIVNAGVNAAGNIFRSILDGSLNKTSFNPLQNMNVLNATAGNPSSPMYGNANDLLALTRMVSVSSASGMNAIFEGEARGGVGTNAVNHVSPYAVDLVHHAPKYKFLFIVNVTFNTLFKSRMENNNFTFLVKQFDRPNVQIEHEEVNMYNFRTRVPKNVKYEPASFQIHDDMKNETMNFFMTYLNAISPISNMAPESSELFPEYGLGFSEFKDKTNGNSYSASMGPLQTNFEENSSGANTKTIIKSIELYHVFNYGRNVNIYHFSNPRVLELQLDELNMSENATNSLTVQFAYDNVFVESGVKTSEKDISNLLKGVKFQMTPSKQVDNSVKSTTLTSASSSSLNVSSLVSNPYGSEQAGAGSSAFNVASMGIPDVVSKFVPSLNIPSVGNITTADASSIVFAKNGFNFSNG